MPQAQQTRPQAQLESEKWVLASMVMDVSKIPVVKAMLTSEDFYDSRHGQIFEAILDVYSQQTNFANNRIELVKVKNLLVERQHIPASDPVFLMELWEGFPTAENAEHYANHVKRYAIKRNLLLLHAEGKEHLGRGATIEEHIETTTKDLLEMQLSLAPKIDCRPLSEIVLTAVNTISDIHDNKPPAISGIPTGFKDLDDYIGGFRPGEMTILAGRPSMGKSTLALNIARFAASNNNDVLIFSFETGTDTLAMNLLLSHAGVPLEHFRKGEISESDFAKLTLAAATVKEWPLSINDATSLHVSDLVASCQRYREQHKPKVILVDYLQLLRVRDKSENRQQEVAAISRELKQMAKTLNLSVLALSQLNRAPEQRGDTMPRLADLRESGTLEQDADIVLLMHRKTLADPHTKIIIAKQRHGRTGIIDLTFDMQHGRFFDYSPKPEDQAPSQDESLPYKD